MSATGPTAELNTFQLCHWLTRYAWRRWLELLVVVATMLFKIGLDVLKPWTMIFLVDYVLQGKITSRIFPRLVVLLPGAHTQENLVAWAVGATVLLFLLSWAVGLSNAYANISLGQRMVYDLAADLFARLQQLSLRFHASKSVGDNIRRVTADCACISTILKDALLPVLSSIISLGAMFAILWRIDHFLTALALLVVPYMMLVFKFYARPMLER